MLSELPPVHAGLEGFLRCRLVSLAIERLDLAWASREMVAIDALLEREPCVWRHEAAIARTRLLLATGQWDEAERWGSAYLREVRRLPEKPQLVLLLARIWLARREFPLVRSWLADIDATEYPWPTVFGDVNYRTLALDLELATGDFEKAAAAAQQLAEEASALRMWSEYVGLVTRWGVALYRIGARERAAAVFDAALERGIPGGFVRSFHVPGFSTVSKFPEAWSATRERMQVRRAVQEHGAPGADGLDPILTRREIEVLHLVAEGYRNQEIADRMFISVNTVRNHLGKLTHRLGVHTRLAAVVRAREFGLID
jgi:LuxR family maltose regulon positive regulatory protein